MRVLLFGASGDIGREVREFARAAGHDLILFARDPSALEPLTEGESVVRGDISAASRVREAVCSSRAEAVISALGPNSNTPDQAPLFEGFATALVAAMSECGVKRLVSLSGGAVVAPGETKSLADRLASALVRRAVPHVVAAKQRELDIVAGSTLEWIAPRPPRVVPGGPTGRYRVGQVAIGVRSKVTRGDLAQFMVAQLSDDALVRQAPLITS